MSTHYTRNFFHYDVEASEQKQRMNSAESTGLEFLIPVINKLRDIFDRTGENGSVIQLPQIVVVGCQVSRFWGKLTKMLEITENK